MSQNAPVAGSTRISASQRPRETPRVHAQVARCQSGEAPTGPPEWRNANLDKARQSTRAYREANREKVRARQRKYDAAKRARAKVRVHPDAAG
jgi:hypothetical protein